MATISSPFTACSQHSSNIPIPRSTRFPPLGEESQPPSGCSCLDLGHTPSLTHTNFHGQPPISLCWAASPPAASIVPPSMSRSLCPKWLGSVDTTPCPISPRDDACCPLLGWQQITCLQSLISSSPSYLNLIPGCPLLLFMPRVNINQTPILMNLLTLPNLSQPPRLLLACF